MERLAVLELISHSFSTDSIDQQVPGEPVRRKVFAALHSISQTEWLEGGRNGHKPQLKAVVFEHDYQNEAEALLNGERYGIYRTFVRKDETIELYLEEKAGV